MRSTTSRERLERHLGTAAILATDHHLIAIFGHRHGTALQHGHTISPCLPFTASFTPTLHHSTAQTCTRVLHVAYATHMPSKQQVSRVGVGDEAWRAFRQLALDRGLSVSTYLGKLVDGELRRRKVRPARSSEEQLTETDRAIAALAEVRSAIDELDAIAGRLARSATAHGASWDDVASSLQLTQKAARGIYAQRPPGR